MRECTKFNGKRNKGADMESDSGAREKERKKNERKRTLRIIKQFLDVL